VSTSSMTLVDLGSANKTYVNGEAIRERPVKYGDELQFAGVRCRLLAPEAEQRVRHAPSPPPSIPKAAAAPRPSPPPPPAPAASVPSLKAKPAPQGRSAPPKIEADPMKRLLRIGGLLIVVSLAFGVLLRVLLVPSGPSGEEAATESASSATATPVTTSAPAAATETAPPPPPPPPTQTTQPLASASTAEGYFDQALSFLDTGRLKEAQAAFRKVLELDPTNTRAMTRLSLLDEEIAQKAEQHFGNARQAFQYLRYDEAIAEWEMFLTLADSSDVRYVEAEQGIQQAKAKLR
ncbi:MAG: tetratricopeptide repeat protein, partial [Vicinamibacteria bacterium]